MTVMYSAVILYDTVAYHTLQHRIQYKYECGMHAAM